MSVGDFASNFKAKKAEEQSGQALHRADEVVDQLRDLRREFERLQMICEGMWTILKERVGATEQQLLDLIEITSGQQPEGRSAKPAVKCARCQRVASPHQRHLYCSAMNGRTTVFRLR
jgi:hypothetical protein